MSECITLVVLYRSGLRFAFVNEWAMLYVTSSIIKNLYLMPLIHNCWPYKTCTHITRYTLVKSELLEVTLALPDVPMLFFHV